MKSQEIFALAIRIAGLISLLYLMAMTAMFAGIGMPVFFVLRTIAWAIFSLWLLRGAPQLVRFAYPSE